jgi:hypothetical protein
VTRTQPQFQPHFTRAWTDAFGSAYTILEGGTGKQIILVIARLEDGGKALEELQQLEGFGGRIVLCVLEKMRQAPVLEALRETKPSVVIALEDVSGIALSGPAMHLEPGEFLASTGLDYAESGEIPAWRSTLEFPDAMESQSVASSLAASQHIPTLACGVENLLAVLELTFTQSSQAKP